MPFLLAEILNFQGSTHQYGVGSFSKLFSIMLNMWTVKLYIFIKNRIDDKEAIPTGTASVKKGIIFS